MRLKIVSSSGVLYSWDVDEVVVPTKEWEIWILPKHQAYAWVIKWWICKFKIAWKEKDFIKSWEYSVVSIWDWAVYTDWELVSIAVSTANSSIEMSEKELKERKEKLAKDIEKIKAKWSMEDIEKAIFKMNKIEADLKLKKYFYKS